MNHSSPSKAYLRKRKMLLFLPVLVLPFLTMAFWALGGGKLSGRTLSGTNKGLNLNLPDPRLKEDKPLDKLSYYEVANQDSAEREKSIHNDPYLKQMETSVSPELLQPFSNLQSGSLSFSDKNGSAAKSEEKVYVQLERLNKELEEKAKDPTKTLPLTSATRSPLQPVVSNTDLDRLENMLQTMSPSDTTVDPEMKQLNGMLDKVIDIQHPERIKSSPIEKTAKDGGSFFSVHKKVEEDTLVSGFYGLDFQEPRPMDQPDQHTIEAAVNEDQLLVTGAVIKLRLLQDITINGLVVPKNNFVFGVAWLNNERLEIEIRSIRSGKTLIPVRLDVFDMDGLPGIYIPGAIGSEAAKQSAEQGINTLGLSSIDPSVGAQAASVSIQAAKSVFSKKARLVKVRVKAGYRVLLKNRPE